VVAHALVSKAPTVARRARGGGRSGGGVKGGERGGGANGGGDGVKGGERGAQEGVVEWWAVSEEMVEGVRSVTPRGAPVIGVLVGRAAGAGGGAEGI